jgi:hypothetical protein
MLWTIIVVLFILWLLGFIGPRFVPSIRTGSWVHILLVIVVILVILNLLHVI